MFNKKRYLGLMLMTLLSIPMAASAGPIYGVPSDVLFSKCQNGDNSACRDFVDRHYRIPWFEKSLARIFGAQELYIHLPGPSDEPVYYPNLIKQSRLLFVDMFKEDWKRVFDNGFTDPSPIESHLKKLQQIRANIQAEINAVNKGL
ncbi:MAG: hypothetical protein OEZ43_07480 [Gammaproteobacteria bacterium]|nr:hypothetical protein [Gammaproteobacteria bacterium]